MEELENESQELERNLNAMRKQEAVEIAKYAVKIIKGVASGSVSRNDVQAEVHYIEEDIKKLED